MSERAIPSELDQFVSRETFERLELLVALLEKWNAKINLVSRQSVSESWSRHIVDSLQIWPIIAEGDISSWVDVGSGGGFPGLVLAAVNGDQPNPFDLTMIESDIRKCSFLRSALREMGVSAQVVCERIERAKPVAADVISARALADLTTLLEFSELHLSAGGTAIFPKGVNWKKEVKAAEESWSFSYEPIKSMTQEGAVILKIGEIRRV